MQLYSLLSLILEVKALFAHTVALGASEDEYSSLVGTVIVEGSGGRGFKSHHPYFNLLFTNY
jgi:hypothetical protein